MNDGPNIVNIAALVGDHARAAMLTALMSGEALTATELATEANITRQTASSHLAKMKDAGLISAVSQGRHRYYRLAADDVAHLLENLMGIAQRTGSTRVQPGPRDPELRNARVCYDHLAGDLAVAVYDAFTRQELIHPAGESGNGNPLINLTHKGRVFCDQTGINLNLSGSRRLECRSCLDWSARRFHLAGKLGAGILDYCYRRRLAKRVEGTRVVHFTPRSEKIFRELFVFG